MDKRNVQVWIIGILLILFFTAGYLLMAPWYLEVDTRSGLFRIRYHRMAEVRMLMKDESVCLKWSVLGWGKTIDLLKPASGHRKAAATKTIMKIRQQRQSISWKRIKAVLRSFQVRRFEMDIDTGDEPLNGLLYPIVYGISRWMGRTCSVNFMDRNVLIITVKNNLGRMVWAYVMKR